MTEVITGSRHRKRRPHFSRTRLYQLEVATSRAATLIGSLGDYVELFGLSSNPAPKIDLPLGDLGGRLDKEPAKNVKTASRENARQRGRLINMRYNLAFDAKSMGDSAKK